MWVLPVHLASRQQPLVAAAQLETPMPQQRKAVEPVILGAVAQVSCLELSLLVAAAVGEALDSLVTEGHQTAETQRRLHKMVLTLKVDLALLNLRQAQEGKAHQCVLADTTDHLVRKMRVAVAETQTSEMVGTGLAAAADISVVAVAVLVATLVQAAAAQVTLIPL